MTQRYFELMTSIIELKYPLTVGFLFGWSVPVEIDWMRIITTIIGTIIAGTVWLFLKPYMARLRDKTMRKNNKHE